MIFLFTETLNVLERRTGKVRIRSWCGLDPTRRARPRSPHEWRTKTQKNQRNGNGKDEEDEEREPPRNRFIERERAGEEKEGCLVAVVKEREVVVLVFEL